MPFGTFLSSLSHRLQGVGVCLPAVPLGFASGLRFGHDFIGHAQIGLMGSLVWVNVAMYCWWGGV